MQSPVHSDVEVVKANGQQPGVAGAKQRGNFWQSLGPGLVSGASDNDPSGIATYSQVGAQFGYRLLWLAWFSYPLMSAIQEICARMGRVTGLGIAGNMRRHYPRGLLYVVVGAVLIANTINIGADIAAMGAALKLLIGGSALLYAVLFAVGSVLLQVFVPYTKYAAVLKWLTAALFAYVVTVFVVRVPWLKALHNTAIPSLSLQPKFLTAVIAVLGTTISPYLFFWQASQEVEETMHTEGEKPLKQVPHQARAQIRRIKFDTYVGMAFSNVVTFFIILTGAVVLNAHGLTDIQTSAQAAEALRPVAGRFAFLLFSAGIIGTGLLAVPVLAGSAAFAVSEAMQWPACLEHELHKAKGFYAIVAAATLIGVGLDFTHIDPIKMLFWTAVINGVVAAPLMAVIMLMATNRKVMGEQFILPLRLKITGWFATVVMMAAVVGLFATWGK